MITALFVLAGLSLVVSLRLVAVMHFNAGCVSGRYHRTIRLAVLSGQLRRWM